MGALAVLLAAQVTLAQETPVTQPPPPATFAPADLLVGQRTQVRLTSAWPSEFPENASFLLHVFRPESESPTPVVILLHYWGATDLKAESDLALRLNRRGISAVIVELPYHLQRAPKGTRSGQLAIQPDPARLRQTMGQAVWDVRRTVDWVQSRPEFKADQIGIAGISLGGFVGATCFAVEPRLAAFASVLGGADLAGTIWSSSRLVRERDAMRRAGWREDSLREALKTIEPTTYLRETETRPAYSVAARYDTIVPAASYRALHQALPQSQRLWLETGHYGGFVVQSSVFDSVARFFDVTFDGASFVAPRRLYAPTLRLGAPMNLENGLQVGIGLDFWKSDEAGTAFGSIFWTPKGPQAFIGVKAGSGFAAGVSILPKRTAPAILWSFVL